MSPVFGFELLRGHCHDLASLSWVTDDFMLRKRKLAAERRLIQVVAESVSLTVCNLHGHH